MFNQQATSRKFYISIFFFLEMFVLVHLNNIHALCQDNLPLIQ